MAYHDYIPRKESDFAIWAQIFTGYLAPRVAQFNFPQEVMSKILTQFADYEEKFRIADDPSTHTPVAVQAKKTAHKLLEKTIREAVGEYLTRNHLLSDDDRIAMGLPVHKTTQTPAPIARDAPDAEADTSVVGRVNIYVFEKGHNHKRAKPAGQHGVEVVWSIRETPPTRWDELLHSVIDTKSPCTLSFENDQRGKTLYFAVRWENTRGEKGPWSVIQSTVIP
jgi:hypothetical protein